MMRREIMMRGEIMMTIYLLSSYYDLLLIGIKSQC